MYARLKYSAPDWLAITEVAIGHSLNGDEHTRLGSNIRQSNHALPKRAGVDYLQVAPYRLIRRLSTIGDTCC